MEQVQVSTEHYNFSKYMTKRRWASIWEQVNTISELDPGSTLEIGPGLGVLKVICNLHGIRLETLDLDPSLKPDHVGSITNLPFADNAFDLICAFQVLEHLDFGSVEVALRELRRVTRKYVLISLPNAQITWRYKMYIPFLGERDFLFTRPFWRPVKHDFDGEHYWEINKLDYPIARVIGELEKNFEILKHQRLWENPYHHFFVLEKTGNGQ